MQEQQVMTDSGREATASGVRRMPRSARFWLACTALSLVHAWIVWRWLQPAAYAVASPWLASASEDSDALFFLLSLALCGVTLGAAAVPVLYCLNKVVPFCALEEQVGPPAPFGPLSDALYSRGRATGTLLKVFAMIIVAIVAGAAFTHYAQISYRYVGTATYLAAAGTFLVGAQGLRLSILWEVAVSPSAWRWYLVLAWVLQMVPEMVFMSCSFHSGCHYADWVRE